MLAVGVVLAIAVVMVAGGLLAIRVCMHVLCRRRQRLDWNLLVARNHALDLELTRIWQRP